MAQAAFAGEWARIAADEQTFSAADAALVQAEPGWSPFVEDTTVTPFVSIRTNAHGQMWKSYPYKAVGKLLVYDDGAYAHYCSASVIGNRNILVTAAHCIYDRSANSFYDAFEFVPAYRNGSAPYGTWIAKMTLVKADYVATGAPGLDVALVSLSYQYIDDAWRPVSYFTGWLGRVWDYDETQMLFAQGYPQTMEDGKFTYTCAAESFPGARQT